MSTSFHVIVVGAGLTGLLLGQGLKKARISFSIFEQQTSEAYRAYPRDWGLTLHYGQAHFPDILPENIMARFPQVRTDPYFKKTTIDEGLPAFNGKTGEPLFIMRGDDPVRVSKKKFRDLIRLNLDAELKFGRKLTSVTYLPGLVIAHFADGSSETGNLLVGCDGIHSPVREILLGPEKSALQTLPLTMFNFIASFPKNPELSLKIRAIHPTFCFASYPEGPWKGTFFWLSLQDVPDPKDPGTWIFQIIVSWAGQPLNGDEQTSAGALKRFKEMTKDWVEPWQSAAQGVKDETQIYPVQIKHWASPCRFDNYDGRITLCGDAAHPVAPHRGQGFNNCIQDVHHLISKVQTILSDPSKQSDTITEYDEEVFIRGSREIVISHRQAVMIHDWDQLMDSPMVKIGMKQAKAGDELP